VISAAVQAESTTEATDAAEAPSRLASWPRALAVLGALALAIGISILDPAPVGVAADDSMYVILAKSLATGQGYHFLNLPGAPAATHFPPGYPALLALLWRVAPEFPGNLVLFKTVNAVCLAVVAMAIAQLVRRRAASASWAMALGVLTAVSVPLLVLSTMLLSELFFLALLLLLLPALENLADGDGAHSNGWYAAGLGLAIGGCMLVRTHAIVLVPAVALVLLMRRRWRDAAIVSVVAMACLLPWQLWSARHGGVLPRPLLGEYDSYTAWWVRGLREIGPSMIPATLQRTMGESAGMFAALFSPLRSAWAHVVTLAALGGLAVTGVAAARRRLPVTLLFLAGYLTIIALWPFAPSRFVWGVWPLLLLVLLCGAQVVVLSLRAHDVTGSRRVLALAGALAMAWVAWGYAAYELRAVRGQWWASIPRANARRIVPAVRWTLANTAPTDVIAAEDDGAVYLYTGRATVPVRTFTAQQYLTTSTPREEAEQGLIPVLAEYPVRYVVVGSSIALAAAQWLAARPASPMSFREELAGGAVFTVLSR
jgi:hypothetical protein